MPIRTKLDWAIVGLCVFFIYVLVQSAYWEPYIRTLHVFQALIYVAIIILVLRHSKWGYGIGISIGAFWVLMTTLGTTFLRNGFEEWGRFLTTGRITKPVVFLAAPAGVDQFVLILCCIWAYFRLQDRKLSDLTILLGGAVISIGYFIGIMAVFNPEFLAAVKHIFVHKNMAKDHKNVKPIKLMKDHERPLGKILAEHKGESFFPLNSLEQAKSYPDGVVILQGDDGGQIYVVCRASEVRCSVNSLENLLSDLDKIAWPDNEPNMRQIFYERLPLGSIVAGGMGGGMVQEGIWVHEEFEKLQLGGDIRAVIRRERERLR